LRPGRLRAISPASGLRAGLGGWSAGEGGGAIGVGMQGEKSFGYGQLDGWSPRRREMGVSIPHTYSLHPGRLPFDIVVLSRGIPERLFLQTPETASRFDIPTLVSRQAHSRMLTTCSLDCSFFHRLAGILSTLSCLYSWRSANSMGFWVRRRPPRIALRV